MELVQFFNLLISMFAKSSRQTKQLVLFARRSLLAVCNFAPTLRRQQGMQISIRRSSRED